ncbi:MULTISPECIES: hypothetical protein [Vibrio]|jgi:hypothetical protein|uniref:hypothetical protein n=1 Tax=Vibrio TaxID=662 RepID=UPI0005AB6144|nr:MULTISPECIES: hypothetical protein [Vibrio]
MRELSVELHTSVLDEAFRSAPDILNRHLKAGISHAGSIVSRAAKEEAPKAESTLTHSIRSNVVGELQRMITSSLRYNAFVAQGTDAQGMPPVQSVLDWVRVKRIQPKHPKADQRDLAFIIARSIAKNGTQGNDFYDRAAEQTQDQVADILKRSVNDGLRAAGFQL